MKIKFFQFNRAFKLQNALAWSILLFLFKLVFPFTSTIWWLVPNEFLVICTFYFAAVYLLEIFKEKNYTPLSIILNAGILNAVIFLVLSALRPIIFSVFEGLTRENFMYSIAQTFYSFIFISALAYIFSVFTILFFLRQKKNPGFYFNTLVVFLAATSISNSLIFLYPKLDYIQPALMVVAILLIAINSIRIPWIAFLTKKEKVQLIFISVILVVLFVLNISLASSGNPSNRILIEFSPSLHQFLIMMMIYGAIFFGVIFFTTLFHLPTAAVYDRKAQEASSLINLSKLITRVFDFKELADTVTDITIQVCNSNSAWLVTEVEGVLTVSGVKNIGYVEADKIVNILSENYDLRKVSNVKTVLLTNSKNDEELKDNASTIKCLAIAPLKVHQKINGFLIAARKTNDQFDEDDQKSIGAFADYAALAIENSKLLEESLEKERLEKELDVAREIQNKILPDITPNIDCLDISAVFIPAFEVGGDYYDFFQLENDKLGFVIADVSGKGISAAFIMAEIKGIFESLSKLVDSPREVILKANDILKLSLEKKNFVTAVYGIFDFKNQKVIFSRAGHMPLLLARNGQVTQFKPGGIGLGLDHTVNFVNSLEEVEIKIKENDILVLFTDGITESKNSKLEDFGVERFERIIVKNGNLSLDGLAGEIMKEVTTFSQGSPQHDDITLVIFKWKFKNNNAGEV